MPLSQDEQIKYKALYLQTARQYINELQTNLEQLVAGTETTDIIDTLHRAAHSLKGQSAMMEYNSMSNVSSVIEAIFQGKKDNKVVLSHELLTRLQEAASAMNESMNAIDQTNKESDLTQIAEDLKSLAKV